MNETIYWIFPTMDLSQFEYNNKTILHTAFQDKVINWEAFDTDYDDFLNEEFLSVNTIKVWQKPAKKLSLVT